MDLVKIVLFILFCTFVGYCIAVGMIEMFGLIGAFLAVLVGSLSGYLMGLGFREFI